MVEEEQKNHLSGEILCEMQTEELAGNSQTLKEPGKSCQFHPNHTEKLVTLDIIILFFTSIHSLGRFKPNIGRKHNSVKSLVHCRI